MAVFIWATSVLVTVVSAAPWTFTHLDSTWTVEVEGDKLHVTADCPETLWCGFGFNDKVPKMDGADVFTFGYHEGVDLADCPSCGCGGCGCGCGTRRLGAENKNPYVPRVRNLKLDLPAFVPKTGAMHSLKTVGGVVGVAMNSVLLVHEHPEEGMTWLFDNCGGHGDTYGHYHYHAPPLCLMKSLGLPVPEQGAWWKDTGISAWPEEGPEVQIAWALDGAPIMGPYKGGSRTEKKQLDECHGAVDASGVYRYYLVPEAPYMPPCLKGAVLGNISNFRTSKEGTPCSQSKPQGLEPIGQSGRVLTGNGCPEHPMFQNVVSGMPHGMKSKSKSKRFVTNKFRRLSNYGTCPAGAACGGCGCGCGATCGCGCGSTTKAACGCGCGATCGCGCGSTSKAACGCGCGCGATCGCGCGSTTKAACGCGCGCGATCGCGCGGCGAYACPGQMFCAMGFTKKASTGTMVSLSQCNLEGWSITIDAKQDLTDYKLKFENGRMKVDAHRALNTGDATDYVLTTDAHYYIIMTVGDKIKVGYHGSSATQTLVCNGTLASGFEGGAGCTASEMSDSSTTSLGLLFFGWLLTRVM